MTNETHDQSGNTIIDLDQPKVGVHYPEFLKVMEHAGINIPLNRDQVKALPLGLSITSVFQTKSFNPQSSKFIKQNGYYNASRPTDVN